MRRVRLRHTNNMNNGDLFQGAIALVTGANKGIGYEIARGLGAKKIAVLIGAWDEARGQAAAAKLRGEGADARFVPLDVTRKETISQAAQWIEDQFGHLDILVNSAGIAQWGPKPSDVDLARVREVYETNLFGPMAEGLRAPTLPRSRHGRSSARKGTAALGS
jgi:NAD(P)-dependent dehydrogenase (short-subunit alcohol dehydrogenase family)